MNIEAGKQGAPGVIGNRLGPEIVPGGVRFSVYSGSAARVELCLFDAAGVESRLPMTRRSDGVWHCLVAGAAPGTPYGFRAHGPFEPQHGLRFNANKLLLDPYARALTGPVPAGEVLVGHEPGNLLAPDPRDSAALMPRCVVIADQYDWGGDALPHTPWDQTIIYECHVKGLTKLHPKVPPELRGTYFGLASPPVIEHLHSLGVTAVELLPVQYFANEWHLAQRGLVNYWGYNTIGFFAPDLRYATAPHRAMDEFRAMVRALHAAGIEVILDVVYNHTAEGDERGPTLSFRGLDNHAYYHLIPGNPARYANHSACGNTINGLHPRTKQLIMDSLRYWASDMHVDGFRFDLAPALSREPHELDPYLRFFGMIVQDPVLRDRKLLVEPWDAGPDGLRLGAFPHGVLEWNGRYRDCVRRFWRGDTAQLAEFVSRLAGSSDIYRARTTPLAGINYVTCHDGSTLEDLVSYATKHNEANGEQNRDGPPDNFSANYGTEGPSDDPEILAVRERIKRNLLATLALSQGVPMLSAGDEMGRTQRGNDNAYCQDNEISWLDWSLDGRKAALLDFTRRVLSIRRDHAALRRDAFFNGRSDLGLQDVVWLDEAGRELSAAEWEDPRRSSFAMLILHDETPGDVVRGESAGTAWQSGSGATLKLLLLVNAAPECKAFQLPIGVSWRVLLSTGSEREGKLLEAQVGLMGRSLILLAGQA